MTKKTNAVAAPQDDWQTEQDLRHMTEAHKIKQDPKRHKAVMAMARKRMQELNAAASMAPTDAAAEAPQAGM